MSSTENDVVNEDPAGGNNGVAGVGTPATNEVNERPADDAQPSSSVDPATNVGASASEPRRGSATSPTSVHMPRQSDSVICDVRDLYYAIELPASRSSGRGIDGNRWRQRAARFCRNLCVRGEGNTGDDVDSTSDSAEDTTSQKLVLLKGVNCRILAGDMVAIIGPSGAGKSTCLDLLAGRKFDGVCAGEILLASGGASHGPSSAESEVAGGSGRASVYVTQEDVHVAELTVRESLAFAVRLSMSGPDITGKDHEMRVEELLRVLGLESCADVNVGNPLEKGISGGQARRLSVGLGVADLESVRLLLLDEPTTGLDSSSATELMNLARRLANREDKRAVVASIHQPSAEVFALFDKVLLLAAGRQAFFGSVEEASRILSRPEEGIVLAPGQNPADFILIAAKALIASSLESGSYPEEGSSEIISVGGEKEMDEEEASFSPGSGAAEEINEMEQLVPILVGDVKAASGAKWGFPWKRGSEATYAVGFWAQVSTVWGRAWMVETRRTEAILALIVKNIFVGVLTSVVFWQQSDVDVDEPLIDPLLNDVTPHASNMMGVLFFGTLYGVTGHLEAIPDMFEWKTHFERERAAGLYSSTVFWLVSSTVHMPIMLAGYAFYFNATYFSLGLPVVAWKYFVIAITWLVSSLMGYSLAQTLSAACNTPQEAFATWPLVLVTAANFTGFTVRLPAIEDWYRWMCEISFIRWPYQLVVMTQFRDYDESSELLDHYFGEDHVSMLTTAAIMMLFYVFFFVLTLFFLLPRRSRLRVLREPPKASNGEASILIPDPEAEQSDEGSEVEAEGWRITRRHARDSHLMVAEPERSDEGPSHDIEEGAGEGGGEKGPDPAPTGEALGKEDDDPLRVPLLGGGGGEEEIHQGSTLAFRHVHYFIYLKDKGIDIGEQLAAVPAERYSILGPSSGGGGLSSNSSNGSSSSEELKSEAHVLKGVSGVVSPGSIMVILGPSGSGKTTLLDLLGGRKTPSVGRREGDIIVDGVVTREEGTGGRGLAGSAYVMQDNAHHSALTVRQTLDFASKLRMPKTASTQQREERVLYLVTMLGLQGVLDTKVGSESERGISGGEAKRLSIAVEVIDLPGLLLLDEPTSGLDMTTALEVMTAVRSLADMGRTVVASLHQPSPEMFLLFDKCLLLTKGGYQAYYGDANRAIEYFTSIGLAPPPTENDVSPADFLISVASIGAPSAPGDVQGPSPIDIVIVAPTAMNAAGGHGNGIEGVPASTSPTPSGLPTEESGVLHDPSGGRVRGRRPPGSATELQSAFAGSEEGLRVEEEVSREVERASQEVEAVSQGQRRRDRRSTFWLSMVLIHRELTATWQNPTTIVEEIFRYAFVGIFYGTLWWRLGVGQVSERVGVLFFSLVFVILGNQQMIPRIFDDRLLFYREKGAGVYGAVEYWLSISFATVPLVVANSFVFGILVYFLAGLYEDTPGPFCYFLLVMVLCNLIAVAFCQMLAAATRTSDTAVSLFPVYLFFFIAFAGFLVRLPTLPDYLSSWAPKISFVRWAMEGLVINEIRGNEGNVFEVPEGSSSTPKDIYADFLDAYGFGDVDEGREIVERALWILVVTLVFFRLLCLLCLQFITFERR